MNIIIEKKYLVVPVNKYAVTKSLRFFEKKEDEMSLIMDFECKLDLLHPNYTAYIDVSRFKGMKLEYCSVPEMEFSLLQTDKRVFEDLYQEEYRPFSHFTPQVGWINDPNGLIKYHGVYHMFYQHNPLGTERGHMHWGHAISKDLIHWEELDIALFPDETGTMYSGSAIEDVHNVSGLRKNENPPMMLFYTAAGDCGLISKCKKRTQCLAVSHDGGKTFEKYSSNPIVDWIESGNRDPKVVWVEELSKFVMVLYIMENRYALLTSDNLLDWSKIQDLQIEGDSECPDIMSLNIGEKKYWVIMGALDRYLVGVFENGLFKPITETLRLTFSQPRISYAAQSFSGMDDGRAVRITWHRLNMPSLRVPHQMSIPTVMELIETDDGVLVTSNPVKEIEALYEGTVVENDIQLSEKFVLPLARAAYDIHFKMEYKGNIELEYFGNTLRINTEENYIQFQKFKMPISLKKNLIDLRLIIDRCSVEIFADGGKYCAMFPTICDYNIMNLKLSSDEPTVVQNITCNRLKSIHPVLC